MGITVMQIQDIVVFLAAGCAAAWLIVRWRKNRSKPCGSCEYCAGVDLGEAVKQDGPRTRATDARAPGTQAGPAQQSDPQNRT